METYNEFINNILNTRGRFNCGEDYHERHHIVPKCCGGTDDTDNLIDLFAQEHYEAHKLLALENPECNSLQIAWCLMSKCNNKQLRNYSVSAEDYEEAKKRNSIILSEMYKAENNPFYGKHFSDETIKQMSEQKRGENNHFYGKHHTDKTRKDLSEKLSGENNPNYGKHRSDETKEKISKANKGRVVSEESRNKMREAWKHRKPISQETRNKLKTATSGKNNPRAKAVYCFELDEYFWGAKEVENKYGICRSSVSQCCNGKLGYAGLHPITGVELHWKYVSEL